MEQFLKIFEGLEFKNLFDPKKITEVFSTIAHKSFMNTWIGKIFGFADDMQAVLSDEQAAKLAATTKDLKASIQDGISSATAVTVQAAAAELARRNAGGTNVTLAAAAPPAAPAGPKPATTNERSAS